MFKQTFELAKTVVVASLRKNLILSSLLIMLPLLLAAWLFEASNPGFQTGFVLDAGASLMAILSVIIISVLAFEQLYWLKEQSTPWFYLSRLKSRIIFPIGKYLGIIFVSALVLVIFSLLLTVLIYFTSKTLVLYAFKLAFAVWLEYSVFLAILVLFSTFMTKLMSVGMMLPVFFIAHSVSYLKSLMPNLLGSVILAILPNAEVFNCVNESSDCKYLFILFAYSLFISGFYLTLAGFVLRQKDL